MGHGKEGEDQGHDLGADEGRGKVGNGVGGLAGRGLGAADRVGVWGPTLAKRWRIRIINWVPAR